MAQTITIEMSDEGQIMVTAEENGQPAGEPYECDSADECLQFVGAMLKEEGGESPEEAKTEGPEDYKAMWEQEAGSRKQPGLMA